jgi:hypothetical protein
VVVVLDARRQALDLHAGDVGPHRHRQFLEIGVQVFEHLADETPFDAELFKDDVAVDAFPVGGGFEVHAGEQLAPDQLGEAPAALGRAAAVPGTGVEVDQDQGFRGAGPVVGPEVVGSPPGKVVEELVVTEGSAVPPAFVSAVVPGQELVGRQFRADAVAGHLSAVVQAAGAPRRNLMSGSALAYCPVFLRFLGPLALHEAR